MVSMNSINNTIADNDFSVNRSLSGTSVVSTIAHSSNTASSGAKSQITVAGTSAGDPFQTFTVTGATSWSHGIDNSSSDSYKLSQSTDLGTTDRLIVNTSGQASIPVTLNVGSSAAALETITAIQSGSACQIGSRSTDNTSTNSNAGFAAVTGGTSGGYPYFLWEPTGGTVSDWSMAADYSGNLYISPSSNLTGAAKTFNWDSIGRVTNTVQPSFFFYLNSNTAANVTGDSTGYVLGTDALTQRAQQGSGMTTGGTFTVPVTGWYNFDVCAFIYGVGAHTSGYVLLQIGGANTAFFCMVNPSNVANASGEMTLTGSIQINLTATNAITFLVTVGGSTKTIGLGGVSGGIYRTYVMGNLLH